MFPEALSHDQFIALRSAFATACLELGLGPDEIRRDELAALMVTLAESGELDPEVIRAHAVHRLQPPASSSFYRG
jgi:membrane carboxypeptidase/penicillin-binding protein PbpC